ncbi:hypothetical protein TYRP_011992, partial [Tyrophagus putrescentiae]
MKTIFALMAVLAVAAADHEMRIWNNCPFTVWPGLLNNPNKALPEGGGFALEKYHTTTFRVPDGWAGNKIQCSGAGGVPPVSLAEFTLDGWQGQDYYDVSLVDGYNLPLAIFPIDGTYKRVGGGKYDCNNAGCKADINAHCPNELAQKNSAGATVACRSACMQFNTD